jgi:hypothetical protein
MKTKEDVLAVTKAVLNQKLHSVSDPLSPYF